MPKDSTRKKLHPIVKPNYLLRSIACISLLLIQWSIWGNSLFTWQIIWMPVSGLFWPHLAFYISSKASDSKQQEILNMHVDTALVAATCIASPSFFYCSVVFSILIVSNSLYVGSAALLVKNIAIFCASLLVTWIIVQPDSFLQPGTLTNILIALFLCTYMSLLSTLGNYLSTKLINLNKKVRSLSITDPLTGAFNRLHLDKLLPQELKRGRRVGYPVAVLFGDLDHFKSINDECNHGFGDDVLKQFVQIVFQSIRNEVDWVARYGGEEFIVVLPNTDSSLAITVAERIRQRVADHRFESRGFSRRVTCSFGIASMQPTDKTATAEGLLMIADENLYSAKVSGRNCIVSDSRTSPPRGIAK